MKTSKCPLRKGVRRDGCRIHRLIVYLRANAKYKLQGWGMYTDEEEAMLMFKFGEYNWSLRAYFETLMV